MNNDFSLKLNSPNLKPVKRLKPLSLTPHSRNDPSRSCSKRSRNGVSVLFVLFLLVMLLILSSFAINWAQLQLVQTELKVATDASARAANRVYIQTGDLNQALATAQRLADRNLVDRKPLQFSFNDFELGTATRISLNNRYDFIPSDRNINAMKVHVAKSGDSLSGPVNLLFPFMLGRSTVDIQCETISTQLELDIALVIDRSGSMAYAANEPAVFPPLPAAAPLGWFFGDPVPPNSRWLDTLAGVHTFLDELAKSPNQEQVALITYASDTRLDQDLTQDYSLILAALAPYTQNFASGGTNIGGGMRTALNALAQSSQERPWATKVIIVMTDGIVNEGPNPRRVATEIADKGAMIFTVTFSNEANQTDMRIVAERGGGQHFHARTAEDLRLVFQDIARRMPTLISK